MTDTLAISPSRWWTAVAIGASGALLASVADWRLRLALAVSPILLAGLCWTLAAPLRWVILFFAAALCLPPLPVAVGDSGPHIALVFAALGLIAGVLHARQWLVRIPILALSLLLLALALIASIAFAAIYSGLAIATASLARAGLFAVSVYVFFYTAAGPGAAASLHPRRWIRFLFATGVLSALFACIDFYYQFPAPAGYSAQFIWLASGVYRRAQGFFYEASTLGNLCVFFLTMVAVALTRPRDQSPVSRPWLLAGAAILFAALILSFSRGSLINLGAGLLTLAWLHRRRFRFLRMAAVLAAGISVAAVLTWTLAPQAIEFYWLRLAGTGNLLLEGDSATLSGRTESWALLSRFLLDHPGHVFFGVGYKTLPYSSFTGQPIVADNAYLSALVETGLAGLGALLLAHAAILTLALRAARHPDRWASFFGCWIACFWTGEVVQMLSGDLLTYWRVLPLYLWTLAVALARMRLAPSA